MRAIRGRGGARPAVAVLALSFLCATNAAAAPGITEYPAPNPTGVLAAGPDGNVWFAMGARAIGRIAPDGTVAQFPFPAANLFGVTAGPDGAIWLSGKDATYTPGQDPFPAKIYRVTTAGGVSSFTLPGSPTQSNSIGVGPDGALWFTYVSIDGSGLDRVGRMTTSGAVSFFEVPGRSRETWSMTAGPDGALWFTEVLSQQVGRLTTDGSITEFAVDGYPGQIVAGPDGALWFTLQSAIGRITTAGVVSSYPVPSQPGAITAGPDGALWFTEYDANKIGRITTSGEVSELPIPTANSGVSGIAKGPDGDIWFSEVTASKLGRVRLTPPAAVPTVTPAVPTPAPRRDATAPTLTLHAVKQSLRDILRKGVAVKATCDEQCSLRVTVSVTRAFARRLHIPTTLATQRFTLTRPATLHLKLSKRANRALRAQRRVSFVVRSTATDAAGNTGPARSITAAAR